MNFCTGSGVRTQVMHRRRPWRGFSASGFGFNACGGIATVSCSQGSNSGNQFDRPSSRTDLLANAASAWPLSGQCAWVAFTPWVQQRSHSQSFSAWAVAYRQGTLAFWS